VTKSTHSVKYVIIVFLACVLTSCTSLPLLVPNPPSGGKKPQQSTRSGAKKAKPSASQKEGEEKAEAGDDVDFSLAFAEGGAREPETLAPPVRTGGADRAIAVPSSMIRVALRQGVINQEAYVMGPFEVRSASLDKPVELKGRIAMEVRRGGRLSISTPDAAPFEAALPCTLALRGESRLFDFGQESYRGLLIVAGSSRLTIVNCIDMDEYLRGVLPLEMGKAALQEIEALKAQAVAARTYAYNRMQERTTHLFDVVRTIADQVYGGANVETPEADAAIAATKGLVLTWNDSLAQVYFHSTCGGHTSNRHEVWDRPYCEYLCSVDDYDAQGTAYCAISPRFTWKESWTSEALSRILRVTCKKAYPGSAFTGNLLSIVVGERFLCGRIRTCTLESSAGENVCGGDKLRFVLRRKSSGGYLLRSANFTVVENGPRRFELEGIGYGHGVGMCQMGAIGRARAGQTFEQILKAYFRGAQISRVEARR
jgi:stage II sporulation protein D